MQKKEWESTAAEEKAAESCTHLAYLGEECRGYGYWRLLVLMGT
jgi:hypothetical protein